MSRIGEKAIQLPEKTSLSVNGETVSVKGPKGQLDHHLQSDITVTVKDNQVTVKRKNNQRQTKALHGLTRSLINNMIIGVSQGYVKKLELVGTGYRAKKQGSQITLSVGYSHPVEIKPVEGITIDLEGETVIAISGINKQQVGHMAAEIRDIRKPEPYKGKGIRYQGEIIRRKAGKAAKVGSAA